MEHLRELDTVVTNEQALPAYKQLKETTRKSRQQKRPAQCVQQLVGGPKHTLLKKKKKALFTMERIVFGHQQWGTELYMQNSEAHSHNPLVVSNAVAHDVSIHIVH